MQLLTGHACSPPNSNPPGVGGSGRRIPRQPRRERSASPAPPLGHLSADLHHTHPGRSRKAPPPTTPPASQAVWDSWRPAGRRVSVGLSGTNPFCIQSPPHGTCKVDPPLPPEISSPGLAAATSGMAPPVRLNFELQPSGPRSLEASNRHSHPWWHPGTRCVGPRPARGKELIPCHKCDGQRSNPEKGSKRPGRLTPSTPGSAHVPGPTNEPNGRPTTNRRAGVFPDGGNICLAMGRPHPQSYIKVVDPPRNLSFSPLQPHSFWSSILPVTVFALLLFELRSVIATHLSSSSALLPRSTASLPVRDSTVSTTSKTLSPILDISFRRPYRPQPTTSIKPLQLPSSSVRSTNLTEPTFSHPNNRSAF